MLSRILETLQGLSLVDGLLSVVDFVVVYFIIYQILMLIRGTRAVQVLVGLLLVIVSYFISRDEYLGLTTVNWLLDKFIGSFILVIIILFQQDIRRGLSQFGRSSFFRSLTQATDANLIEELLRAAGTLSKHRIGALIAIERGGDLAQFADEGIRVDAALTRDLLYAIFNPANANPLHDGAVIVRGDRIVSAGCFLPLTSNPRVDKQFGTRHRAAIGLTEDTDALVLVVSEETGAISIVHDGQLERPGEINALRDRLQSLLGVRAAPASAAGATARRSERTADRRSAP